jgi:putative ABC transport system permease protein
MIKHFLIILFRNFLKQRIYSTINILGLAIGLASTLIILLWVFDEITYDSFHLKADRIYRMIMDINTGSENSFLLAQTPPSLSIALKDNFPEIKESTRISTIPKTIVQKGEKALYERNGIYADQSFFSIFTFPVLAGDINLALQDPNSIILTESFANKYLEKGETLDKSLLINGQEFKVTSIINDIPGNSHLQFDFVIPLSYKEKLGSDLSDWGNVNLYTYFEIDERVNPEHLKAKISSWNTPRYSDGFLVQELLSIHRTSGILAENSIISDGKYVYIFTVIAALILLIACLNFISLSTAQATKRAKEVGIRVINGSSRVRLIQQFLGESFLYTLLALILGIILVELTIPYFNQLVGKQLELQLNDPIIIITILVLYVITGTLSGIYPALVLSSYKPLQVIKGIYSNLKGNSGFRSAFLVLQYTISIVLIAFTLIIYNQFRFISNKNLGFNQDDLLYLPYKDNNGTQFSSFKNRLLQYPFVESVTAKNSLPILNADKTNEIEWAGKPSTSSFILEATGVDPDYLVTMNLKVLQGKSFPDYKTSPQGIYYMLNEEAIRQMNLKDPIGQQVNLWGYPGEIIGIYNNAHFRSFRQEIEPQILYPILDYSSREMNEYGVILIKLKKGQLQSQLSEIKNEWGQIYPDTPFEYHFLDQAIDNQYWKDKQVGELIQYLSILAIIVSSLGLLGLSVFTAEQRTKEIGIRKVMGASSFTILKLFSSEFFSLILIANVVSWPIIWYIGNNWLEEFVYRTSIGLRPFLIAGLLAMLVAIITISRQALISANKNPVEVLKYE